MVTRMSSGATSGSVGRLLGVAAQSLAVALTKPSDLGQQTLCGGRIGDNNGQHASLSLERMRGLGEHQ